MSSAHFQPFLAAAHKAIESLKIEFSSIRSSRVSPALLERVKVEAYGSMVPIQQVGAVSVLEGRTIEIRAWDPAVLSDIEKAISKSDLGVSPVNDGKVIRLAFPALTEDRRKEYVTIAKRYAESAKVALRNARRVAQEDAIAKPLKDKKIAEDEKFKRQTELDSLTNKFVADVDVMFTAKEKEIVSI